MNSIELITKFSPKAWDTVYKQEAMSSMLDSNSQYVQFTGAKTVKIGKWQNGGLHNYYRNNDGDSRVPEIPNGTAFVGYPGFGYQKSNTRLVWEEFTLKVDRAAAFQIEKFDNEESGEELVGLGVTEISRTTMVPEVDAYCFSTLAGFTSAGLGNRVVENLDAPLSKLNTAFLYFANHEVPVQDQICFVSPSFLNALRTTTEITKYLGQTDYDNKDIKFVITKYEGRPLVEVSPERFRTDIFLDTEGYTWGADSTLINFLLVSKSAVTHITKYEKIRVIGDDLNLAGNGFDGYTIYARVYHDVFVPYNKRVGIYASVAASTVPSPLTRVIDVKANTSGVVESIIMLPGDLLCSYEYISAATAPAVGDTASGGTALKVGVTLPAATATKGTFAYAVLNGKIIAVQEIYKKTA